MYTANYHNCWDTLGHHLIAMFSLKEKLSLSLVKNPCLFMTFVLAQFPRTSKKVKSFEPSESGPTHKLWDQILLISVLLLFSCDREICFFKGKCWQYHRQNKILSWNISKLDFFFKTSLIRGPQISSILIELLASYCKKSSPADMTKLYKSFSLCGSQSTLVNYSL